jgi:hypothetical protein
MLRASIAAALVATPLLFAAPAHAEDGDVMYLVGTEIQPGTYRYTVTGEDWGSWELCNDARCNVGAGLIDMDMIDGEGHTGYLTIPSNAKYVKLANLTLTPMH